MNARFINSILPEKELDCMSHPCGDYNNDTLLALKGLGIKIGFRSNMRNGAAQSALEIPREDHANVYKEMMS